MTSFVNIKNRIESIPISIVLGLVLPSRELDDNQNWDVCHNEPRLYEVPRL